MTSTYCTSGVLKEFVNVVLITSTETIGLFRDGGQWGKGVRRWGKREFYNIYIPIATLSTTRMTPALRRAASHF